ncbi:hypothetical protein H181DRAFT_04511 [Streptomyces sp. WMMB 714]|nr:hypothetical protein H181DRAFT_04511 [Streptomyces sp. WMMB 714]
MPTSERLAEVCGLRCSDVDLGGYWTSGFVVVDELGRAVKTDWLRRRTYERMKPADVRKVRLYDARHACLSWMANNGVPDTVVSA